MRSELKFRLSTAGMIDTRASISVHAPVSGAPAHLTLNFIEKSGERIRIQRHVMYPTEGALLGARLIQRALDAAPGLKDFGFTAEMLDALGRIILDAPRCGIERLEEKK